MIEERGIVTPLINMQTMNKILNANIIDIGRNKIPIKETASVIQGRSLASSD